MRLYTKVLGVVIVLVIIAAAVMLLLNPPAPEHMGRQVNIDLIASIQVLDLVNNTPVPGSTVYFVACCPGNTSLRDVHLNGLTGDDGRIVFSANYTLDRDQTIYLGASNLEPLVESDFREKRFNGSGYLGEWKSFNYSVLYNSQDNSALVSCFITVDVDTGKLI